MDVVVGFVETHGRADTESLCLGLPEVPPREIDYRGVALRGDGPRGACSHASPRWR